MSLLSSKLHKSVVDRVTWCTNTHVTLEGAAHTAAGARRRPSDSRRSRRACNGHCPASFSVHNARSLPPCTTREGGELRPPPPTPVCEPKVRTVRLASLRWDRLALRFLGSASPALVPVSIPCSSSGFVIHCYTLAYGPFPRRVLSPDVGEVYYVPPDQ